MIIYLIYLIDLNIAIEGNYSKELLKFAKKMDFKSDEDTNYEKEILNKYNQINEEQQKNSYNDYEYDIINEERMNIDKENQEDGIGIEDYEIDEDYDVEKYNYSFKNTVGDKKIFNIEKNKKNPDDYDQRRFEDAD